MEKMLKRLGRIFLFYSIICIMILPHRYAVADSESNDAPMKFLSYNVQFLPVLKSGYPHEVRARAIIEQLRKLDYDIIAMQEVFNHYARKNFVEQLEDIYPEHVLGGKRYFYDVTNSGVLLLSKWPLDKEHEEFYKACSGFDCLASKGFVSAIVKSPHGPIRVVATHLQSVPNRLTNVQRDQLRQISNFLENAPYYPTVIMGDLNIDKYNTEDEQFLYKTLDTGPLQLTFDSLPYSTMSCLNNVNRKNNIAKNCKPDNKYLDYILLRNDVNTDAFQMGKARVVRIQQQREWGLWDLSDHFAVERKLYYR